MEMVLFKYLLVANICAIALISASSLSHSDGISSKIVGGFETAIEKNPWQVALLSYGHQTCGGSIISENFVITAAHCSGDAVRVGSSYHGKDGQIIRIRSFVRHQNYTLYPDPIDYDFAIVELEDALIFTDKIQPIALPDADAKILEGTMALVTGWGYTKNATESYEQLRAVYIPIANHDYCREQYKNISFPQQVTDRNLCAGFDNGTKSPCYGDSGGPLSEYETGTPRLIGVVSWGLDCGVPYFPAVFSSITSVRQWIKETAGI